MSTGPTLAGSSVTFGFGRCRSPCTLSILRPCFAIASRWAPRAMKKTSWPAAAMRAPKYPPTAPAAIAAIRISDPSVIRPTHSGISGLGPRLRADRADSGSLAAHRPSTEKMARRKAGQVRGGSRKISRGRRGWILLQVRCAGLCRLRRIDCVMATCCGWRFLRNRSLRQHDHFRANLHAVVEIDRRLHWSGGCSRSTRACRLMLGSLVP